MSTRTHDRYGVEVEAADETAVQLLDEAVHTLTGLEGDPVAAISVAATRYTESPTTPREPEFYSSRGPSTDYFRPVSGTTPAAALATPEVVAKPDITATDCASTTFFAWFENGAWAFCGTSEAAPHAAAVAALMKQTKVVETPGILEAMQASATHFTKVTSPDAVGNGSLARPSSARIRPVITSAGTDIARSNRRRSCSSAPVT